MTQSLAAPPPACMQSLLKSITQNKVTPLVHTTHAAHRTATCHPTPPHSLARLALRVPCQQSISGSDYATLATVTADGLPTARTVWIRQLYQSRALLITTDARSAKTDQLAPPHLASLCHYLPLAKEQYRLLCHPTLVTCRTALPVLVQLRETVWHQSPDWLQQSFTQPAPGRPVDPPSDGSSGSSGSGVAGISEWFVVVLLWPVRCDYLRLPVTVIDNSKPLHRESRLKPQKQQQRWLHTRDATTALWTVTELNP